MKNPFLLERGVFCCHTSQGTAELYLGNATTANLLVVANPKNLNNPGGPDKKPRTPWNSVKKVQEVV